MLNVIGDVGRECPAAVVDTPIGGARIARELDRIAELGGYPCLLVSDKGTELNPIEGSAIFTVATKKSRLVSELRGLHQIVDSYRVSRTIDPDRAAGLF